MRSRKEVVKLAQSWVGLNEKDGSYKKIIDIYNSQTGFPRGCKMKYSWAWCACTWSSLAIQLGYQDIMPIEISCYYLIEKAKKMGIWKENDGYIPSLGDAILYDWEDNGIGDNIGSPDHVGAVEKVDKAAGYFVVIEGNYSDQVKRRTVSINGKYIRGFITPKYTDDGTEDLAEMPTGKSLDTIAHEVIVGTWGSGDKRKLLLENHGYSYEQVQKRVNEILNGSAVKYRYPDQDQSQPVKKTVRSNCYAKYKNSSFSGSYKTTSDLYCRNDAGTNKKALCLIPKGTKVECYGFYSVSGETNWLLIDFIMDGVRYNGFSCIKYLKRI